MQLGANILLQGESATAAGLEENRELDAKTFQCSGDGGNICVVRAMQRWRNGRNSLLRMQGGRMAMTQLSWGCCG